MWYINKIHILQIKISDGNNPISDFYIIHIKHMKKNNRERLNAFMSYEALKSLTIKRYD